VWGRGHEGSWVLGVVGYRYIALVLGLGDEGTGEEPRHWPQSVNVPATQTFGTTVVTLQTDGPTVAASVLATSNGERPGLSGTLGGTGKAKKASSGVRLRGSEVSGCIAIGIVVGWLVF
jgi:hypothetical protein